MPVAPAIATPSRSHATLVVGAGTPLQLPAETVTGSPIRPVPARTGARTRSGGTILTATVATKETVALPPEFVAVTVTVALPAAVAGTLTRPLASTVAPPPATAKTSALAGEGRRRLDDRGRVADEEPEVGERRHHRRRGVDDRERRGLGRGRARGVRRRHPRGEGLAVVGRGRRVARAGRARDDHPVEEPGDGELGRRHPAPRSRGRG